MDNYHGDLADILGSSIRPVMDTCPSSGEVPQVTTTDMWQLSQSNLSPMDDFGNPFCTLIKDPLFEDLDNFPISTLSSNIFTGSSKIIQESATTFPDDDKFSNMIQISSKLLSSSDTSCCSNSSRLVKPLTPNHELICNDHVNHMMISGNSSSRSSTSDCFIENRRVQISSPQYTGIKRRKGQAKKVVCIPAPAPVNSRPTGEIVPSDLWAWRKYGQKPIKGSPYPRGYYRCSSSKGCSARKQVERSRTDPNMLVITYTSEHNHPWPTQRNALAGSTRNQPSKNSITGATKNSPSSNEPRESPSQSLKEEHKEMRTNTVTANNSSKNVKDEEKDTEMEDVDPYSEGFIGAKRYRPALLDSINHPDKDMFAELGEIEANPLELMFTQGFTGQEESESNKALDPYWSL